MSSRMKRAPRKTANQLEAKALEVLDSRRPPPERDHLGVHAHDEALRFLNTEAQAARELARPWNVWAVTARVAQQEADRLDHHMREHHRSWTDVRNHDHQGG